MSTSRQAAHWLLEPSHLVVVPVATADASAELPLTAWLTASALPPVLTAVAVAVVFWCLFLSVVDEEVATAFATAMVAARRLLASVPNPFAMHDTHRPEEGLAGAC